MFCWVLLSGISCGKSVVTVPEIEFGNISSVEFDAAGGLGTAEILGGGNGITAVSSEPDWLRVEMEQSEVRFNVFCNMGGERSAEITVTAEGSNEISFSVTQAAFRGLVVSHKSLEFSDSEKSLQVLVRCDSDYDVSIPENPGEVFSFVKGEAGVTFTVGKSQGRHILSGKAVITPTDNTISPFEISLFQDRKEDWYYLLGEWTVSGDSSIKSVTLSEDTHLKSFFLTINTEELSAYKIKAPLSEDGKVLIAAQGFGENGGDFYSIHYNGGSTNNPSGWYIWIDGSVAWGAVPVFDDEAHTVKLTFSDAKTNASAIPSQFNLWRCQGAFFNFGSGTPIVQCTKLVLTKEYID